MVTTAKRVSVSKIGVSLNPSSPKKQNLDIINRLVAQVVGRAGCDGCGELLLSMSISLAIPTRIWKNSALFQWTSVQDKVFLPLNGKPIQPLGVGFPYFAALPADLYRSGLAAFVEITPETLAGSEQLERQPRLKLSLTAWRRHRIHARVCRL